MTQEMPEDVAVLLVQAKLVGGPVSWLWAREIQRTYAGTVPARWDTTFAIEQLRLAVEAEK